MPKEISLQKSIERERAKFAYECAEKGRDIKNKAHLDNMGWFEDDKYKSYVQKFPMLIKTNGLASTIAFYNSKKTKTKKVNNEEKKSGEEKNPYNAYDLILYQLTEWLKQEPKGILNGKLQNKDLIKAILELNSDEYRAVTNEVLSFLTWLKRFAEGLIE